MYQEGMPNRKEGLMSDDGLENGQDRDRHATSFESFDLDVAMETEDQYRSSTGSSYPRPALGPNFSYGAASASTLRSGSAGLGFRTTEIPGYAKLAFGAIIGIVFIRMYFLKSSANSPWQPGTEDGFKYYPSQIVAWKGAPKHMDGDVFEEAWERIPWSSSFQDIRGPVDAPAGEQPSSGQTTRVKMMWDNTYVYAAFLMQYEDGDECVAKQQAKNKALFHTDSVYEIYVDPAGCGHGYKQLQMNANAAVWNLMLTQPYSEGGKELSARVGTPGERDYWDVLDQDVYTRWTYGEIGVTPAQLQLEIRMPRVDMRKLAIVDNPAAVGRFWRVQFSRHEPKAHQAPAGGSWWSLTPTLLWNPGQKKYEGQVDLHAPDAFGYLLFADEYGNLQDGSSAEGWKDPAWPAKHAASCAFHVVKFLQKDNTTVPTIDEVQPYLYGADIIPDTEFDISAIGEKKWRVTATASGWRAIFETGRLMRAEKTDD